MLRVACCVLRVACCVLCASHALAPLTLALKQAIYPQLHKTYHTSACPLSGGRWLLTYLPPPLLLLATPPLLLMSWAAAARSCLRVAPFKPMHLVPIMILHTSNPAVYLSSLLLYLIYSYSHNTYKAYVSGIKLKTQADYGLSDHTAVLHEDNMYIYGGVSFDNNLLPTIQVFNFGIATPSSPFILTSHTPYSFTFFFYHLSSQFTYPTVSAHSSGEWWADDCVWRRCWECVLEWSGGFLVWYAAIHPPTLTTLNHS